MSNGNHRDELVAGARRRQERHAHGLREGEPTLARQFARVGVLGWMIITPTLAGIFIGHFIDHRLGSGIFWTAPSLLAGLFIGCCLAWKWMHTS